jgi:diguanylate cyclase (GGDEF)-like protein
MAKAKDKTESKAKAVKTWAAREDVGRIGTLWADLTSARGWSERMAANLDELVSMVDKLERSSGALGLGKIANLAAPLLVLLRGIETDQSLANVDRREQAAALVAGFAEAAASPLRADGLSDRPEPQLRQRLILVGDDHGENCSIALKLEHYGYQTLTSEASETAFELIADQPPGLVILVNAETKLGSQFMSEFPGLVAPPPLIAISSVDDFDLRLAATRAGCSAFLVRPGELADLIDWVDRISGSVPEDPYRVLIVDDDAYLSESYALMLDAAGMNAGVLNDPSKIFDRIEEDSPDVILMDLYMPRVSGFELAKVVRQTKRYLGISIMFLSTEGEMSKLRRVLNLGGDDYLTRPLAPDQLVLAVSVRAARARALRALMDRDSLTGLLNHTRICEDLEQEVARAERAGHPLSLAILDLDHFKRVNDKYGHQAGDTILWSVGRLLSKRLRRSDSVGRYGGEEFAVVFKDTDTNTAFYVTDEIRRIFARVPREMNGDQFHLTLSAGISGWEPGMTAEDMIELADSYLYKAKAQGRNRVVTGER